MDIMQLRYFLTTAETLNYTKAAEKLFLSRQALRQALSAMEKELGLPLFINQRNKLSLTGAGEYLKLAGQGTVDAFDEMMTGIQRFAKKEAALKVALSVSLFPFMLPEMDSLLRRFARRYPAIRLEVSYIENDEVLEAIEKGEIDCGGVVRMPNPQPGIVAETLSRYQAIISYGEKYRNWEGRVLNAEDLKGLPCIGMGSLQRTLRPFYETCLEKGIAIDYEVVPRTIDAFYRISHNEAIGFDIGKEDLPDLNGIYSSLLEGFLWEVGLIYRENSPHSEETRIFCRFIAEEYGHIKAEQQQSGRSPLSGL